MNLLSRRVDVKSFRVLLVDDSEIFRESVERSLSLVKNVQVVGSAASGEEALRLAGELNPDLILMDLAMPGMNGLQATRILKEKEDAPSVIILTMYDSREYRRAVESVGADGFVAKSEFGEKLLPTIKSLLAQPRSRAG